MLVCDEGNHYFPMISRGDVWECIDERARCLKYQAVVEHTIQSFRCHIRIGGFIDAWVFFHPFALKK
ncbi:hypothetical protein CEV08_03505 [Bartonella tribocorum]|uniref:Uncharacterized protein n=1 Tax=Bartonella tribocorum TaxID=85701 RepID=A0A2M6UWE0_9HYPH|nr:hypothetical protein CEV08_03505 [Bartonella tribocorum]